MKIEFEAATYSGICKQMIEMLEGSGYLITTVAEANSGKPFAKQAKRTNRGENGPVGEVIRKAREAAQEEPLPEGYEGDDARGVAEEAMMREEDVTPEAEIAVSLLKLKNEQLDRLRELFNAGKGSFVRELLAKYGEGAKVFPEVDAKHFPQIKADIDRELN